LLEEESTGTTRTLYTFNGRVVAERTKTSGGGNTLHYLHSDHLGSVAYTTSSSGALVSRQDYTPWGDRRGSLNISETALDFTGQRRNGTGLLFYNARC
jgi:uncharacterized protein RhaS with RHS repeats